MESNQELNFVVDDIDYFVNSTNTDNSSNNSNENTGSSENAGSSTDEDSLINFIIKGENGITVKDSGVSCEIDEIAGNKFYKVFWQSKDKSKTFQIDIITFNGDDTYESKTLNVIYSTRSGTQIDFTPRTQCKKGSCQLIVKNDGSEGTFKFTDMKSTEGTQAELNGYYKCLSVIENVQ